MAFGGLELLATDEIKSTRKSSLSGGKDWQKDRQKICSCCSDLSYVRMGKDLRQAEVLTLSPQTSRCTSVVLASHSPDKQLPLLVTMRFMPVAQGLNH